MRVFREKRELAPDIWQIEGSEPSVQRVIVMNAKTNDVIGQSFFVQCRCIFLCVLLPAVN